MTAKEKALQKALKRLLWISVADDADCTCEKDDVCVLCEAWSALALGVKWPGAWDAGKALRDQ